jgi:hypothetical protein
MKNEFYIQINVYEFLYMILHIQINVDEYINTNPYIQNRIKKQIYI